MSLLNDIQKLEPGEIIRLFEIDGTEFGADIIRFHSHAVPHTPEELQAAEVSTEELPAKSIWWQGQEYRPWPSKIEGIEDNADGSPVAPTLTVANLEGAISALCLAYENMEQAKVTVRFTLAKYLDAVNFPDGNEDADPEQEGLDVWFIDRKTSEDKQAVTFELASPADLSGRRIGRQMTAYCHWAQCNGYRGADCGYAGAAMFDEDDQPTTDPALDQCSGTVTGCALRFGENEPLPHGGFIAVRLIR